MVMPCSAPVSLSRAVTCRMPLASMSKVTSICGSPRGAGRMFSSLNRPSTRLSVASSRSPCSTTISTAGWLSAAVVNTSLRRAGMVVLRSMILVITPPAVSTPSESGVTSSSKTSETSPLSTPAWMRGAQRDHLVGVDGHVRVLAAGEPADQGLHGGDAGRAADQDDLVDVVGRHLGVGHRLLDRAHAALDQIGGELLELRPHAWSW